jgi:hypothetical protein
MSAAPPGQGGHHHVNCKDKKYWIEKFEQYGFEYLPEESEEISKTSTDVLVKNNSMFFRNKTIFTFKDREPFVIEKTVVDSSVKSYIEKGGPVD